MMPTSPIPPVSSTSTPSTPGAPGNTVSAGGGEIDFIDTVLYTGAALGVDFLGIIPVVGEIATPLGIGGFQLFFWLKGISPSSESMLLMGGTMGSEIIPVVSEVMPGCTAFVLTRCLLHMANKKGSGGGVGAIAGAALAVETGGASVAAEQAFSAQLQGGVQAAGQAGVAESVGATGQSVPGGQSMETSSPSRTGGPGAPSSSGSNDLAENGPRGGVATAGGEGGDFSGQVDFSSFGKPDGATPGESKRKKDSFDSMEGGSWQAGGSPVVPERDSGPIAQPGGKTLGGFEERRRKQREKEEEKRPRSAA